MTHYYDDDIERHLVEGTEEADLRSLLGDHTYEILREESLAVRRDAADPTQEILGFGAGSRPKIYILPGIMGSKLSARTSNRHDLIWFDPLEIRNGGVSQLKFGDEPRPVVATGTFWAVYGLLRLRLRARGYAVTFLPFDWRHATPDLGRSLIGQIDLNHEHGVVLAAHSMGGLVARQMAALDTSRKIKRIVTMGTPNYGSYSPVQVFRLASPLLSKIGWLDKVHTPGQIADRFLKHFPGLVEMMPDPEKRPDEAYFKSDFWPSGGAKPTVAMLKAALQAKTSLPAPDDRFRQIIGYGQETVVQATNTGSELAYKTSLHGDGTVPVDLAAVDSVPQYYVEAVHGKIAQHVQVARAIHDLIQDGRTDALPQSPPLQGVAQETMASAVGDNELRQINQAIERPEDPTVHDILSEFIPEPDPQDGPRRAPVYDTNPVPDDDMMREIGGYPLSVLMQASETWQGSDTGQGGLEAVQGPRDTDARIKKYAERKLRQLRSVAEETPKTRVLPDTLRDVVAKSEISHFSAIDALLDERVMGEAEEFLSVLYLKRAPIVSKSVGRIIRSTSEVGFGTGFMVAPRVLITNHHVLPTREQADRAAVQFDYEINYRHREMQAESFLLRPDLLFYANRDLDFALVAVDPIGRETGRICDDFGYLPLDGGEGKIKVGNAVNVIQHPNAERKQVVFRDAALQALPANNLHADAQYSGAPSDVAAHYRADTKPGSSGSPVFSDTWEVIALHHSAVAVIRNGEFRMRDGSFRHPSRITSDKDVDWVANEGIRISRITNHLNGIVDNMDPSEAELVRMVLQVGRHANKYGHFARMLPAPVLSQLDKASPSLPGGETRKAAPLVEETLPRPYEIFTEEGLFDAFRDFLRRPRSSGNGRRAIERATTDAVTVDGAGVATGPAGLPIIYRGDPRCPYGKTATARQKPFDSIVLHHNDPRRTTEWLIRYQIDGDPGRDGHFGYHFYIDPNGQVFQGAPLTKRTNHVKPLHRSERTAVGRIASNTSAIGVSCVKAGPRYDPTPQQVATQDRLVQALAAAFGISLANVFGHGELQTDRHPDEGTREAAKIRSWAGGVSGQEAYLADDDDDDAPLDDPMGHVSHGAFSAPVAPHEARGGEEDSDDETPGAIRDSAHLGLHGVAGGFGSEATGTQLVYDNANATRNRPCTADLEKNLVLAVEAVYGPGCRISIYSGGQDRLGHGSRRLGSIRHDDFGQGGRAADIYVYAPSGQKIRGLQLARLGQYWLAAGYGGVGHEMGGGGIHLDDWVTPPPGGGKYWTYAASDAQPWGPEARAMLARGAAGHLP